MHAALAQALALTARPGLVVYVRTGSHRTAYHPGVNCPALNGKRETYDGQTTMHESEALALGLSLCGKCGGVRDKLIPLEAARVIAAQVREDDVTPLRQGRVYAILAAAGYGAAELVALTGRTWNHIDLRLSLLDLSEAGQQALDAGTLPVGLAWYVAKLSAPAQRLMLTRWERGDFSDAHEASDVASAIRRDEAPAA